MGGSYFKTAIPDSKVRLCWANPQKKPRHFRGGVSRCLLKFRLAVISRFTVTVDVEAFALNFFRDPNSTHCVSNLVGDVSNHG